MKKLVIAMAVILMLAGASVSVMKWMNVGPFAKKGTVAEAPAPKPAIQPRFVDMEPLVVSVFDGDKLAANIQIGIKLETLSDANASAIQKKMPKISDAFLRDLHDFLPRLMRQSDRIDVVVLKDRLKGVADKVMGKNVISGVLIQSVHNSPAKG